MKKFLIFAISAGLLFAGLPANAAPKPKCSGKNLTKYQKAVRQEAAQWKSYKEDIALEERYRELTGEKLPGESLVSLSYRNWLNYGYALEKYAKICKMKMRPEWYEMLDSLPVD